MTILITVQLFGAFRRYLNGQKAQFSVPKPSSLQAVLAAFADHLQQAHPDFDPALLKESAFANDQAILSQDTIFEEDTVLSVLPPVCGG